MTRLHRSHLDTGICYFSLPAEHSLYGIFVLIEKMSTINLL